MPASSRFPSPDPAYRRRAVALNLPMRSSIRVVPMYRRRGPAQPSRNASLLTLPACERNVHRQDAGSRLGSIISTAEPAIRGVRADSAMWCRSEDKKEAFDGAGLRQRTWLSENDQHEESERWERPRFRQKHSWRCGTRNPFAGSPSFRLEQMSVPKPTAPARSCRQHRRREPRAVLRQATCGGLVEEHMARLRLCHARGCVQADPRRGHAQ